MKAMFTRLRTWARTYETPIVRRSTYERLRQENTLLKSAIHEANKEIRKQRQFIGGIRNGTVDVVGALDRIRQQKATP